MILSEKIFYSSFVLIIVLAGFLIALLDLIFGEGRKTLSWMMTFLYTLYFTDFWNHKKTGETSAFRRDAFFIAQMFLWPYNLWGA